MKSHILSVLFAMSMQTMADPQLTSWFTANSGKYARIYTSTANRNSGTSAATWTGQTSPVYAGVSEINYSTSWVYVRNSGMASFVMGPWSNPNLPKNQAKIFRFPRIPSISATKTLTTTAAIGLLVDGVAIYNTSDGFSYDTSAGTDDSPTAAVSVVGDGIWNRDAFPNESISFDYALSHNPPSGEYHSHVNPIGTRYVLGDNVLYDSVSKNYSENIANTNIGHSPIIGWFKDGLPLYGPYGYDGGSIGATGTAALSGNMVGSVTVTEGGTLYQNAPLVVFSGGGGSGAAATAVISGGIVTGISITSGGSGYSSAPTVKIGGVRRMVSGYQVRNGTNGTTNLTTTGRTTLATWALASRTTAPNTASPTLSAALYGPAVNTTYALGHFAEDYDYLGDLGYTPGSRSNAGGVFFDLNKYNVRFCVTPEFPNGTWAYFTTIDTSGTSVFPYGIGPWYYGSPIGGSVTTLPAAYSGTTEPVQAAPTFIGGPSKPLTITTPAVTGASVTLTWDAVEGGTYSVDASTNQSTWTSKGTGIVSTGTTALKNYTALGTSGTEYGRVNRTALATYDTNGLSTATVAQTTTTPVILSLFAPTLASLPTFSQGTSQAITFSTVTSATGYTIQASTLADFSNVFSSQNVVSPSATFTSLSSGTLYYYRATATNGSVASTSSNTVSSTQDASSPTLALTAPATGSNTTHNTVIISGTAIDTLSGMASLSVNGSPATTSDGYAHWTATVPLASGANSIPALATDSVGNSTTTSVSITRNISTQNDGLPDSWKVANSIDPDSAAVVNGPLGDIDFDGRANLLEYAFNTSPQTYSTESVSFDTTSGFLELSFPRRIGALDLVYSVEVSDALLTWSSSEANYQVLSTTPNINGITETVVVRVLAPIAGAPRKLARVRVSQQ